jgi:hypothetical protein
MMLVIKAHLSDLAFIQLDIFGNEKYDLVDDVKCVFVIV